MGLEATVRSDQVLEVQPSLEELGLSGFSGDEIVGFGEGENRYEGTINQALAECPHLRMLPKEALQVVLESTVVSRPVEIIPAEKPEAKKKLIAQPTF